MILKIHRELNRWGDYVLKRAHETSSLGFSSTTHEGRLAKGELPGNGCKGGGRGSAAVPSFISNPHWAQVSRLVSTMPEHLKLVVCVKYTAPGRDSDRLRLWADMTGKSYRTYARYLHEAHTWLSGKLED